MQRANRAFWASIAVIIGVAGPVTSVWSQSPSGNVPVAQGNSIENLQVTQQGGAVLVKLSMKEPLKDVPGSFSVASPARIAFDFLNTGNALGRSSQTLNEGDLRSINVVQVGDRTRVVMNLSRILSYSTRVEGNALLVTLSSTGVGAVGAGHFAESSPANVLHSIRGINFRRGKDGEGRVVVDLSDNNTGIDIRQQGAGLIVEFLKTTVPDTLSRKLDVTDFATPVTSISTVPQGENVRLVISPNGLWEHNAYQSDNQFVVEVKRIVEDPNKLVQGSRGGYKGEKLSLNFQNIDVRAVLQVIADFTNFNIITSETVGGNLTLRLKDVPWDQALDIILQAKGLDMRKNGNVVWIAPRDELAAKEKLEFESRAQITDLEPLRTESFQLNYHKAKAIHEFLKNRDQTVLSKRGSVIVDERTNKVFVTDVGSRLDDLRRLIKEIDVPVRQVLIEARMVEAEDTFSKNLGARLGLVQDARTGNAHTFANGHLGLQSGAELATTAQTVGPPLGSGQLISGTPLLVPNAQQVNLPASGIAGRTPGVISMILFKRDFSRLLTLELSALEADGKGKVISSPRVLTADQYEAVIEAGVELPYQQATSSGATSIAFRKANLSLKVKPQITPDGRIIMSVDINKDTPNTQIATGAGVAIDTKHVKTEVLVENGGTVVIGGIFTQDERQVTARIPFFGDLPYIGFLFKNTEKRDNKTELLVFLTPRIVNDALSLQ